MPGLAQIPASTRKLLDYPPSLPLNLTQKLVDVNAQTRIFDIQYDSPRGGRVTGYLVEPVARGRFAGIVFGHWGEGNRTEFLPEAIRYAGAGAVCVLIDDPWERPEPWRRKVYAATTTAEQDGMSWRRPRSISADPSIFCCNVPMSIPNG